MTYTEVTKNSYGSRIGNSIKGFFFGILLVLGSIYLLWWNEGRTIDVYKGLNETAALTVTGDITQVNPELEGEVVYNTGETTVDEVLVDEVIGFSSQAIKIIRDVQYYQWEEEVETKTEDNLGGSETVTKTYTYTKKWSSDRNNSDSFKESGHENKFPYTYAPRIFVASKVNLGALTLSDTFVNQINASESIVLTEADLKTFRNKGAPQETKLVEGVFYLGSGSITEPQIGDTKISYSVVLPLTVSTVGKQVGNMITSHQTSKDTHVALLEYGVKSQEELFAQAQYENKIFAWALRGLGLFLMYLGFSAIFGIFVILAKVVPFVSRIIGFGTSLIAFVLTMIIGGMTIVIAWIAVRPLLALTLIVAIVGTIIGAVYYKKSKTPLPAEEIQ